MTETTTSDTVKDAPYARDPRVAEFFGFVRGSGVFSLNQEGGLIARKLFWPEEPVETKALQQQFSFPFLVSGLDEVPMIPVGLTIVSGATASGKSSFIRLLGDVMRSNSIDFERLLAVEPHDDGEEVLRVRTFSSADTALAEVIVGSYQKKKKQPKLFAIDSLRAPLFEVGGAAGSKGISMPFFTQITRVSNCLAKAGISVIATINPMEEDADYVKSFMSKLSASVPATVYIENFNKVQGTPRFSGYVQLRPDRTQRKFTFGGEVQPQPVRVEELEFQPISSMSTVRSHADQQMIAAIANSPI